MSCWICTKSLTGFSLISSLSHIYTPKTKRHYSVPKLMKQQQLLFLLNSLRRGDGSFRTSRRRKKNYPWNLATNHNFQLSMAQSSMIKFRSWWERNKKLWCEICWAFFSWNKFSGRRKWQFSLKGWPLYSLPSKHFWINYVKKCLNQIDSHEICWDSYAWFVTGF